MIFIAELEFYPGVVVNQSPVGIAFREKVTLEN